jgi:hypothetical protein
MLSAMQKCGSKKIKEEKNEEWSGVSVPLTNKRQSLSI